MIKTWNRGAESETGMAERIPTNDPAAALAFCRSLNRLVADQAAVAAETQDGYESSASAGNSQFNFPGVSIVLPIYNECENLPFLMERLFCILEENEIDFEVICIDDGSQDSSLACLKNLVEGDRRITIVALARNFGHQAAISAGLEFARGEAVIVMDADLQDPPEVLPQFIMKWREGYDVVYAVRAQRKEGWLKRYAYAFFYRLLQRVATIDIPLDAGDFCIMDRRVVDILNHMPERNRFVRGIRSWVGLKQIGLSYERQARYAGRPKYTISRLIYLALDGLVSFSFIPLRLITLLGFSVSLLSILLAVGYVIMKLTMGLSPPGFATLVVAILLLSGVQLVTIGVIGEYVGRIFEEVKRRPLYVVDTVIRAEQACES